MPSAKFKNYLHLHFLVFIAGFTAILGELITIKAIPLVWFRMLMASILMLVYIILAKISIKITIKSFFRLAMAGCAIALHWITFFAAIDVSNISIALTMFSTGAFFASIIEPLIYKRKVIFLEIIFGILVILGVFVITQTEIRYISGIILGISSAILASLFAVLNGNFLKEHSASVISFYEFVSGVIVISIFILVFDNGFTSDVFILSTADFWYLFILASICTAYAFVAVIHVMKVINPFSVVLTYNLEPVYGIIVAVILFPEKEKMSSNFYLGATLIIMTVLLNGILKINRKLKRKQS